MSIEKGEYLDLLRKYLIILHIGYGGGPHHIQMVEEMYQDLKIAHANLHTPDQATLHLPAYPYQNAVGEAIKDVISSHMKK